jgi:hypothetical protein
MGIASFFRSLCGCLGGTTAQKPKIAELVQSTIARPIIVEKAADEVGLATGMMGGCVSVIYLYGRAIGPQQNGEWLYMRGQHGSGGIGNINWQTLLAGLTPTANDRAVVVSASRTDFTDAQVTQALPAGVHWWRAEFTNALVMMDGEVSDFPQADQDKYIKRPNMPQRIIA